MQRCAQISSAALSKDLRPPVRTCIYNFPQAPLTLCIKHADAYTYSPVLDRSERELLNRRLIYERQACTHRCLDRRSIAAFSERRESRHCSIGINRFANRATVHIYIRFVAIPLIAWCMLSRVRARAYICTYKYIQGKLIFSRPSNSIYLWKW